MSAYDSNLFDPPAPVAIVNIRDPKGGIARNVPMLIDSGSDVSLVPRTSIDELDLEIDPTARYEPQGFDWHQNYGTGSATRLDFRREGF